MDKNSISAMPLVSIIIPVYNTAEYLREAVDSVIGQTYKNTEIILIDDGSKDESSEICDEYAQKYPNVVTRHNPNSGLSKARNFGLELSHGEYIIFMDSDDWMDPETCDSAVKAAIDNNVDIVIWSYIREYGERSLKRRVLPEDLPVYRGQDFKCLYHSVIGLSGEQTSHPEKLDSLSSVWNKLYKRSVIGQIRFVDTSVIGSEDLLFNICCFKNSESAAYIDGFFLHYRKQHSNSLTRTYSEEFFNRRVNLINVIKDEIDLDNHDERECFYNRIALDLLGLVLMELISGDRFSEIKRRLKSKVLCHPYYSKALEMLDLSYMPIHWKLFYGFGKKKNATMLLLMGKSVRFLKKRV